MPCIDVRVLTLSLEAASALVASRSEFVDICQTMRSASPSAAAPGLLALQSIASAKATVPVLQLPDGRVLEESLEIMRWALEQHDPQGWLRLQEPDEALALIALNDGPFKLALDGYKYAPRHPERPRSAWRDEAVELMLAPLNTRLADRPFLLRDTASLPDMAIAPFIRQFAAVEPGWFETRFRA